MNKEHLMFLLTCILILLTFYIFGLKINAKGIELVPMDATAYCDQGITASGEHVRVGICAMRKDFIGKTAIVYSQEDGVVTGLIGIYEIKDTGGHELIKTGKCVDIYMLDRNECFQFGRQKVLVQIVDAVG